MKKLFVLGSFLTIFLFLFGCQSESPISPNDQDITSLEKGRQLNVTGVAVLGATSGFVDVDLEWPEIKNVAGYKVIYNNLLSGQQMEEYLLSTDLSYTVPCVMLQQSGESCEITVQAYKMKKGVEVIAAMGTQTFTYSGTYLGNINFNGTIYDSPQIMINNISPWTGTTEPIPYYMYTIYPSWLESTIESDKLYLYTYPEINIYDITWPDGGFTANDYVVVTLYRYNQDGDVLTHVGNKTIFYNPN